LASTSALLALSAAFLWAADALQKPDPLSRPSTGPGVAHLTVKRKLAGEAAIANFDGFYGETLDIGSGLGLAGEFGLHKSLAFTGHIETDNVELL
jgi:hypothetical protein